MGLREAAFRSNVILLLAEEEEDEDMTPEQKLKLHGRRLIEVAEECARYAATATMVVCVPPVSMTYRIVEEIYKREHSYNPRRLLGSVATPQVSSMFLLLF